MVRVTLRDIAAATGLTVATVSRALSGKDQIAEETRQRVRETAESLGYVPDPALARLAAWRWGSPKASVGSTLAVLTDVTGKMPGYGQRRIDGMREQAKARGYGLEVFRLRDYRDDPGRLARVLESRGIAGVVVERINRPGSFRGFPWSRFSCVAVGIGEERLPIPSVTTDLFSAVRLLWAQARARGYRRIGQVFLFSGRPDPYYRMLAATRLEQGMEKRRSTVPILDLQIGDNPVPKFEKWVREHRPEVVLGNEWVFPALTGMGIGVPGDIAFATHAHPSDGHPQVSGASADLRRTGRYAVDLCHLQNLNPPQQNEVSPHPTLHLIQPEWIEGKTLPNRPMPSL